MMLFLKHIVATAWAERIALFWPIWLTVATSAAIAVAWLVRQTAPSAASNTRRATFSILFARRSAPSHRLWLLGLFVLFLAAYVAVTLAWEDFANYDDSMFTFFTLKGRDFAPPIWPENGRFFPLGYQEFNLLRHFTDSAAGYHVVGIAELLVLSGILVTLDEELSLKARTALAMLALITPSILISYSGLIYPESHVLFYLGCLMLCVKRFEQTQAVAWAVAAVLCAQIVIYYKETAFLLLLAFALGRLVLRCRNADRPGWSFGRLKDKESYLDFCFAALAVVFVVYYAAVMLPHPNMRYADEQRLPLAEVLFTYIELDLLAWLFVAVVLVRTYLLLRRRVAPLLFWDGLAIGGVTYFGAYLYLRLAAAYYLAPVDLISVLYVGRFALLSGQDVPFSGKAGAMVLLVVVLSQDVSLSGFRMFEQKNVVHAKAQIASVVAARYASDAGNPPRLFFPFASPYMMMEFASYLEYRGIPVEGIAGEPTGPKGVKFATPAIAKDGPCLAYRNLVCYAVNSPSRGDLVIVLPDDSASVAEITPYQERGESLLFYEPRPSFPRWLYPLISTLRVVSPVFSKKQLPDRWLYASVTAWR